VLREIFALSAELPAANEERRENKSDEVIAQVPSSNLTRSTGIFLTHL